MTEPCDHNPDHARPLWLRVVLGRPLVWVAVLTCVTFLALVAAVTSLRIEADFAKVIRGGTAAYADFQRLETEFGQPTRDEILVVRADDFGQPETFLALEDLVLELQLAPSVGDVLSLFTLPDPDGHASTLMARRDMLELSPAERLQKLADTAPLARFFLSADRRTTILMVLPRLDAPAATLLTDIETAIGAAEPHLSVSMHGISAMNREIGTSLFSDQAVLIPLGVVVCLLCTILLFRSWRAAIVCGVAPVLALIWTLGLLAATGTAFTPFNATIPIVIIVLGVADSVHVYHTVLRNQPIHRFEDALAIALWELLPAIALATGTTALAFLSLFLLGSPMLSALGAVGILGLSLTFLAVFLAVPLAMRVLFSRGQTSPSDHVQFMRVTNLTLRLLPCRTRLRVAAMLGLCALLAAQEWGERGYDLMDHIPYGSPSRAALAELERDMPGSGVFFIIVDGADKAAGVSATDRARLGEVAEAIYGTNDAVSFIGRTSAVNGAAGRRFMGEHKLDFALPMPTRLSTDWRATLANAAEIDERLVSAGLDDVTTVTGYTKMVNIELPQLVAEMRRAFYFAVIGVTLLIWLLFRSVFLALVSLVPNLIPILGVEAVLAFAGTPLTLTAAISLTIAFGIAVDDTVHVINRTRLIQKHTGLPMRDCVVRALSHTVTPIFATSVILTFGFLTSAFSSLPSIAIFGSLAAGATVLALMADLVFFPALILWRWDIKQR